MILRHISYLDNPAAALAQEQEITAAFKSWYNGHHEDSKRCRGEFDEHISLCAFHAGARFIQDNAVPEPPA